MKISQQTRDKIAHAKADAYRHRMELERVAIRLGEHPGTKRTVRKLESVISKLEAWEKEVA